MTNIFLFVLVVLILMLVLSPYLKMFSKTPQLEGFPNGKWFLNEDNKFPDGNGVIGAFDIVPSQQLIQITDTEAKPSVLIITPMTVVTWRNDSSDTIKLIVDVQGEKKMTLIKKGETWSYPYTQIKQYEYMGGYLDNPHKPSIGQKPFIYGRVIVTGI